MRVDVLTAVSVDITVLWDVTCLCGRYVDVTCPNGNWKMPCNGNEMWKKN